MLFGDEKNDMKLTPWNHMRHVAFSNALNETGGCREWDNASLLLAQVMDFGYPQFTEAKILSEYIKTDAYKMEVGLALTSRSCRIGIAFSTSGGIGERIVTDLKLPVFIAVTDL